MNAFPEPRLKAPRRENGFALLVAIFALLIMSTVAVAALLTSDDEARASRATRAANASFYAAEAGLQKVWGDSAMMDSLVNRKGRFALTPGASLDLGTMTLSNGVKYLARVRRYDNGGQQMYALEAQGRGPGGLSGQQQISFLMTGAPGTGPLKLGKCCDAAATSRGKTRLNVDGSIITGFDTIPPSWPGARCPGPRVNKPGIRIQNSADFSQTDASTLAGSPQPLVEDPTMDSTAYLQYGDISFSELRAMANHVIGSPGASQIKRAPAPTLNADGTCKTSDPWNWGSSNPTHPCYNYFPIILIRQEIEVLGTPGAGSYGQGIIIMDLIGGLGVEFELEPDPGQFLTFAGIILGFGCPEIEDGAQMFGAVYGDGVTANPTCGGDGALRVGDGGPGLLRWSSCVVQMVLAGTGTAVASGGVPPGGMNRLSRGVLTVLR